MKTISHEIAIIIVDEIATIIGIALSRMLRHAKDTRGTVQLEPVPE